MITGSKMRKPAHLLSVAPPAPQCLPKLKVVATEKRGFSLPQPRDGLAMLEQLLSRPSGGAGTAVPNGNANFITTTDDGSRGEISPSLDDVMDQLGSWSARVVSPGADALFYDPSQGGTVPLQIAFNTVPPSDVLDESQSSVLPVMIGRFKQNINENPFLLMPGQCLVPGGRFDSFFYRPAPGYGHMAGATGVTVGATTGYQGRMRTLAPVTVVDGTEAPLRTPAVVLRWGNGLRVTPVDYKPKEVARGAVMGSVTVAGKTDSSTRSDYRVETWGSVETTTDIISIASPRDLWSVWMLSQFKRAVLEITVRTKTSAGLRAADQRMLYLTGLLDMRPQAQTLGNLRAGPAYNVGKISIGSNYRVATGYGNANFAAVETRVRLNFGDPVQCARGLESDDRAVGTRVLNSLVMAMDVGTDWPKFEVGVRWVLDQGEPDLGAVDDVDIALVTGSDGIANISNGDILCAAFPGGRKMGVSVYNGNGISINGGDGQGLAVCDVDGLIDVIEPAVAQKAYRTTWDSVGVHSAYIYLKAPAVGSVDLGGLRIKAV